MSTRFDLLLHPVRMQIVQAFAGGRKLSARDLAARLGNMPPETIEQHLKQLIEGGAIVIAGHDQAGGGPEPLYMLNQAASISPADLRMATPADHMRYVTTFVAGLLGTYSRYLKRPDVDPVEDGVSVREMTIYLTNDELRDLKQDLFDRIQKEMPNGPEGGRTPRVFAWVIVPEEQPRDDDM